MSVEKKRVAIVGGGLGGMTAAKALLHFAALRNISVSVVVYERDEHLNMRDYHGYSLTVRTPGLTALYELGLKEALTAIRSPSKGFFIRNSRLERLSYLPANVDGVELGARCPRNKLRNVIAQSLPKGIVRWNSHVVSARRSGAGQVRLVFADGKESDEDYDLLVVADGSRSKLRTLLLPDERTQLSGVRAITARCLTRDVVTPITDGHGMILNNETICFLSPVTNEESLWSVSMLSDVATPEVRADDPDFDLQAVLDLALETSKGIGEPLPSMIKATIPSSIRMFDLTYKYPHRSMVEMPITFLGDACHPMTPFSGNGANVAITDGFNLAEQLTSPRNTTIAQALAAYDVEMIPRATKAIDSGLRMQNIVLTWHRSILKRAARSIFFKVANLVQYAREIRIIGRVLAVGILAGGVASAWSYSESLGQLRPWEWIRLGR